MKCEIKDTGVGISKEDQATLINMFGQIKEQDPKNKKSHGVGIGLTVSNELVKELNKLGSKDARN